MIQSKCYKCGGERILISRSIDRPDYASHTEDDCLIAMSARITALEQELAKRFPALPAGVERNQPC